MAGQYRISLPYSDGNSLIIHSLQTSAFSELFFSTLQVLAEIDLLTDEPQVRCRPPKPTCRGDIQGQLETTS